MRASKRFSLPAVAIGVAALAAASLAGTGSSAASTATRTAASTATRTGSSAASTLAHATASATPIYLNPAYPPAERAADLVSRMTTAEKAQQMDSNQAPAIPRLGVAAWGWWNESNHGVSFLSTKPTGNASILTNTTVYPTDLAMGSTWNPQLVYQEARQIGAEAREVAPGNTENLDFYAPTVNLSRDPRWGRNDETWSEDPTLTADLASQYVDGVQGETQTGQLPKSANGYYQAITTLKHYAANNTENTRLTGSSDMDQRNLREYYTAQFASIIAQSHPGSIMSSYNEVNGTPSPANVQLNQQMARETFGFNGYFTSDCDAIYVMQHYHNWTPPNSTVPVDQFTRAAYANSAGEDLDCNAGFHDSFGYGNTIPTALTQNIHTLTDTYNIGDVDTSVVRLFTARIETGEFDSESMVPWVAAARKALGGVTWVNSNANNAITETPQRLEQAQQSADQSLVLLKNSGLLPLKIPSSGPYKLAVIGYFAHPQSLFLGGYASLQAAAGAANNVDAYTGIKAAVQAINPNAQVDFYPGVTGGTTAATLTTVDPASVAAAKNYDAVVVVAATDNTTGTEGVDRSTLALPGAQAAMIQQVEAANPHTIAYLETMGEVDTSPFLATTPALLWSSYNGQRQGAALADVLLGKVNPSGHLPFTWYANVNQIPPTTDYNIRPTATTDGRTYMYFTGDVSWPFGYGQSYAAFRYSHLSADRTEVDANGSVTVGAEVTNTSPVAGATVAQLYASTPDAPAALQRPAKRLEGFQKVFLGPGQTRHITFTVKAADLAFFNETTNRYQVDDGRYGLQLGTSSSDIAQQVMINVTGALRPAPQTVTVQPVMPGDAANDVAQRVFFPVGATIVPQVTVSLSDQSLYGYITKGQSTPLPAGMIVRYASDRPDVVQITHDGEVIRAVGAGPATVRATVIYHGRIATGSFIVDVG
ncbi:MAG: glycoside hydrolase family 3 C-terminal domain-containing protein [Streptosporangiaceae bacterium]|nr:glycoside hydrolase family 3 C-terminal domain-containing protein [Streptosporangiaceae bacterium]